jgi:hypothetical protein
MKCLLENHKQRDHLGDIGIYGRIILKLIFKKYDVKSWTGFIWLRLETSYGLL